MSTYPEHAGDEPDKLVVDSSVAVKWFMEDREEGVRAALDLLERHGRSELQLWAPAHMRLEVLNALRYRDLDAADMHGAASDMDRFHLEWAPLDHELCAQAAHLAVLHGLTLYDAAFAALATVLDAELVTADRTLAKSGACRARLI